MSHDFIQNAVNALYQSNELMALKGELANLKAKADQSEAENARLKAEVERLTGNLNTEQNTGWTLFIENARHREQIERLTKQKAVYIDNDKVLAEMERLKAEVKEKTALIAELHKDAETSYRERMYDEHDINEKTKIMNGLMRDKEKLQAQVERLTKAALQVHQELDEFGQVSAKSVHELRDAVKGVQS